MPRLDYWESGGSEERNEQKLFFSDHVLREI